MSQHSLARCDHGMPLYTQCMECERLKEEARKFISNVVPKPTPGRWNMVKEGNKYTLTPNENMAPYIIDCVKKLVMIEESLVLQSTPTGDLLKIRQLITEELEKRGV